MGHQELTDLEAAVLDRLRQAHPELPRAEGIEFISRENTGAGRFIELDGGKGSSLGKAVLGLAGRIEMDGLENGLGAVLFVGGRYLTLELHTFTGSWDGVERDWKIKVDT